MSLKSMISKNKEDVKKVLDNEEIRELIENKDWETFFSPYDGLWLSTNFIGDADQIRYNVVNTIICMLLTIGVNIFEGLERLPDYCFVRLNLDDADIKTLVIPDTVNDLGSEVFNKAYIPSIYLPMNPEYVAYDTFREAYFDEIHYPGTLNEFEDVYGDTLAKIAKPAKLYCSDGEIMVG